MTLYRSGPLTPAAGTTAVPISNASAAVSRVLDPICVLRSLSLLYVCLWLFPFCASYLL